MIQLRDTIELRVQPDALLEWFAHLPDHYRSWHPDHVTCRFEGSEVLRAGARLHAEEYLHGRLHKLRLRITRVIPSRRVDYRIAPGLRGFFLAEPTPAGTMFTAELDLGVNWPIVGPLVDRVLRVMLPRTMEMLRLHMKEEGINLKRILEENMPPDGATAG